MTSPAEVVSRPRGGFRSAPASAPTHQAVSSREVPDPHRARTPWEALPATDWLFLTSCRVRACEKTTDPLKLEEQRSCADTKDAQRVGDTGGVVRVLRRPGVYVR